MGNNVTDVVGTDDELHKTPLTMACWTYRRIIGVVVGTQIVNGVVVPCAFL